MYKTFIFRRKIKASVCGGKTKLHTLTRGICTTTTHIVSRNCLSTKRDCSTLPTYFPPSIFYAAKEKFLLSFYLFLLDFIRFSLVLLYFIYRSSSSSFLQRTSELLYSFPAFFIRWQQSELLPDSKDKDFLSQRRSFPRSIIVIMQSKVFFTFGILKCSP